MGAYACGPLEEPEAGAGWAFATAAARDSDVWVITRRRFAESVSAAFEKQPELAEHLSFVYVDLPDRIRRLWKHDWDMYWYYAMWQRLLTQTARELHRQHRFDVLHHATFANDWMPCGLAAIPELPMVWGPVGGASRLPYWRLRRWLGLRGVATELLRDALTGIPRRIWGVPAAKRAQLIVGQNPDVARHFSGYSDAITEPNAALDHVDEVVKIPVGDRSTEKTAVFAGRLIGWKGTRLALDAIAHPLCGNWRLDVYGDGHDRAALIERADRAGIADRVEFKGHRPRAEVLAAFERADAMLFPSMHDQAGWVVAEASSLGCPVVCLPLGGPPLLAQPNDFVASLEGDIVANVAEKLVEAGRASGVRHNRWSRERLPDLVTAWYDRVTAAAGQG